MNVAKAIKLFWAALGVVGKVSDAIKAALIHREKKRAHETGKKLGRAEEREDARRAREEQERRQKEGEQSMKGKTPDQINAYLDDHGDFRDDE
jgi:hypothetical protein